MRRDQLGLAVRVVMLGRLASREDEVAGVYALDLEFVQRGRRPAFIGGAVGRGTVGHGRTSPVVTGRGAMAAEAPRMNANGVGKSRAWTAEAAAIHARLQGVCDGAE